MKILTTIIAAIIIVLLAVLLLGIKIFFTKERKFPNIHIGGNKMLKSKGVDCATTQDRKAQKQDNKLDINKIIN